MDRFRDAARIGDLRAIVSLLEDGGIPEDVAERTAEGVLENAETLRI
jgi:hypothetical protein